MNASTHVTTTILLDGPLGPTDSFELAERLAPLTGRLRPHLDVDLREVTELHPSVVSVLVRHQRQARRQGGELRLTAPTTPAARHTLDQIGLCELEQSAA